MATIAACTAEPNTGIGLAEDSAGRLTVTYLPCAGEVVSSVTLIENPTGRAQTVWQIRNEDDSRRVSFKIGQTPVGWLASPDDFAAYAASSDEFSVEVMTSKRDAGGVVFRHADIRPGSIWSDDGTEPAARFSKSKNYCS